METSFKKLRKIKLNSKGQALLFVVVAMTIALTVGIALSSRTISSLRRTSNTDTSSRVFSAAEGGIEWFLRQPISVLDALSDGSTSDGADCPEGSTGDQDNAAACVVTYEPVEGDNIQSKALITVEKFTTNSETTTDSHYWFTLNPGSVKEVALKDYQDGSFYSGDIEICWKSQETTQSSGIYYMTYGDSGILEKQIVSPTSVVGTFDVMGDVPASSGKLDYDSCHTINIADETNGLRIKTLYAPSKVGVFATGANFSTQGYKITSLGEIDNVSQKIKATKQISVYRSLPYAPSVFDYALYSDAPIQ